jgi:hypothetical protein
MASSVILDRAWCLDRRLQLFLVQHMHWADDKLWISQENLAEAAKLSSPLDKTCVRRCRARLSKRFGGRSSRIDAEGTKGVLSAS